MHAGALPQACYTLSRLKGIETLMKFVAFNSLAMILLYTFPFEGN